jgi:hypothetical protein
MNLQAISELAGLADYTFAFAIRAIGAIGVADHLRDGSLHIDELATRSQCDRHALLRVMRALATKSVFVEQQPLVFGLDELGQLLRTDHPLSMRWFFRLEPDVRAMAGLESALRTGRPAFNDVFGMDYFDWMAAHPEARERFRESQRALNRLELLAIVRAYPWQNAGSIVDVGGNDGALVSELLRRHTSLKGAVFDLPANSEQATAVFAAAGVQDRARIFPGDVFKGGLPPDADVYIMKRILVGFSDEQAVLALTNVRKAMGPRSRLLIMEPLADRHDQVGISLDLRMLVLGLGRVRTCQEFEKMFAPTSLKLEQSRSAGLVSILEAVVADG